MYNAHVVLFYRYQCWLMKKAKRPMAQLVWYTMAQLEENPGWKP
jgi:hypothetical protein